MEKKNENNTSIIPIGSNALVRAGNAIEITKKLLNLNNKYYKLLTDEFRIRKSIKLARYYRLTLDGFFDPNESQNFNEDVVFEKITTKLSSFDCSCKPFILFYLPKSNVSKRESYYIEFTDYCIRILFGSIIFEEFEGVMSENVFGGKKEIFSFVPINNFKPFIDKQKKIIEEKKYNFIHSIDIKQFYNSINQDVLLKCIKEKLTLNDSDYFYRLIVSNVKFNYVDFEQNIDCLIKSKKGIVIGSTIDGFFQNIVLHKLDKLVEKTEKIKYLRLTDDIKIFSNTKEEVEYSINLIRNYLSEIGLIINEEKTEVIDLSAKEYIYYESFNIYYAFDSSIVDVNNNQNIIENGLEYNKEEASEYDKKINIGSYLVRNKKNSYEINDLDNEKEFLYYVASLYSDATLSETDNYAPLYDTQHLNNLIYIIKKRNTSWREGALYIETYFQVLYYLSWNNNEYSYAIGFFQKNIISLLNDNEVDDYYKYRILRTLFLTTTHWYTYGKYTELDNELINVLKIFKTSKNYIISTISNYILQELKNKNNADRSSI